MFLSSCQRRRRRLTCRRNTSFTCTLEQRLSGSDYTMQHRGRVWCVQTLQRKIISSRNTRWASPSVFCLLASSSILPAAAGDNHQAVNPETAHSSRVTACKAKANWIKTDTPYSGFCQQLHLPEPASKKRLPHPTWHTWSFVLPQLSSAEVCFQTHVGPVLAQQQEIWRSNDTQ